MNNIWMDGIMGVVVGDALGTPVQFLTRHEIKNRKNGYVKDMEEGEIYEQPAGTWSDDSSMTIATLISIVENKCINTEDIMNRFVDWEKNGNYTPFGEAFDEGNTCCDAIYDYIENKNIHTCGRTDEFANGNGALMRILPICLYCLNMNDDDAIKYINNVSGLTHNHLRSKIACGLYYFIVKEIIKNKNNNVLSVIQRGIDNGIEYYENNKTNVKEIYSFKRLFRIDEFKDFKEIEISSSGYVVDSLEAAIWCFVNSKSFKDCLLMAVNLGDDTDTIAAIAGGLAGLYYGYDAIPIEWLNKIQKKQWIEDWILKM